jgi:hypothetical protein
MTTSKKTALLTIALVAIFTGTMISAPQMNNSVYAQGRGEGPPGDTGTVPACPDNYNVKPNPGGSPQPGYCQDGDACPPDSVLINGKCVDGDPKCPPYTTYNKDTDKCEAEGKCPDGFQLNKYTDKCEAIPDVKFCPPPVGGPGPGDSHRDPVAFDGICFIKPGAAGPDR